MSGRDVLAAPPAGRAGPGRMRTMLLQIVEWLQPRDYIDAGRILGILATVAAVVTIVFAAVQPNETAGSVILTIVVGLLVALAGWRVQQRHEIHPGYWAAAPFIAIALIVALDFVTHDASTTAQIFFFFPMLYAASQLRLRGALIVTGATVIGDFAVVLGLLPVQEAVVAAGYVGAAIFTAAGLLIRSGERQEALVLRLRQLAAVDPLTGLATRRVLDSAAQAALSGAASDEGTVLMLIDVDRFKSINDGYGHPAGDAVLVQLSQLVADRCRPSDVASRLGGDEIAMLLVGCPASAMASRAEGMLQAVREHTFLLDGGATISISVSAGLAHAPSQAETLGELYQAADEALYTAKRLGRDRFALASGDNGGPERTTRTRGAA